MMRPTTMPRRPLNRSGSGVLVSRKLNVRQGPDLDDFEAGVPTGFRAGRNQCTRETMPSRLLETALELAHAAHLTRQTQLTNDNEAVRQGAVVLVADDRQGETEIGGRLRDADAARHADEDVRVAELVLQAFLQHREDHVQTVDVDAVGDPPHHAVVSLVDETLDLDEQGPGALER